MNLRRGFYINGLNHYGDRMEKSQVLTINKVTFTRREIDIMACILHCRGSKKVGEIISIAPKTVDAHTRNIMLKIGNHSREGIIDFIETSNNYDTLKQHYQSLQNKSNSPLQSQETTNASNTKTRTSFLRYFRLGDEFPKQNKFVGLSPLFITVILAIIGALTWPHLHKKWVHDTEHLNVRSDLPVPTHTLIERPALLAEIDRKINKPQNINVVALLGIGGSGKTVLAHQYVGSSQNSIVWEINAQTESSLLDSFESLAFAINKALGGHSEISEIHAIKDKKEYEKRLLYYVKKGLKRISNWLLVYDNIEDFSLIHNYFPCDPETWGTGKIIITSINENVKNNRFIGPENCIYIKPLNPDESKSLFLNINPLANAFDHKKDNQEKSQLEVFLSKIPPFPLDISIAAYYIRNSGISFNKYLEYLEKNIDKLAVAQKHLLRDISPYKKTRYAIITRSFQDLTHKSQECRYLLSFASLLDSYNIPIELLRAKRDEIDFNNSLYELRRYSLVMFDSPQMSSFSMHRSTQKSGLRYLNRKLNLAHNTQLMDSLTLTLEDYMDQIATVADELKMRKILRHGERFLTHKSLIGPQREARIAGQLGRIYFYLGENEGAKRLFTRSVAIYEHGEQDQDTNLAWHLSYLGKVCRNLGDYVTAQKLLLKSLHLYKNKTPQDKLKIAWISVHLGNVYRSLGKYHEAIALQEESLAFYKKKYGENHIRTARTMVYLASVYGRLKEYRKAYELIEKSYPIFLKHYGPNHILTAWVKIYLGRLSQKLDYPLDVIKTIEDGLNTHKKYYGDEHIQTAWAFRALGRSHLELGHIDKALLPLEKSYQILHNQNHPDQYISLEVLSELHLEMAKQAKKKGLMKQFNFLRMKSLEELQMALKALKGAFPSNSLPIRNLHYKIEESKAVASV